MTVTVDSQDAAKKEARVLLDQIMRGEKVLLLPPGAGTAATLMVLLCIGVATSVPSLDLFLAGLGYPDLVVVPWDYLGAVALVLVASACQLLVIWGHERFAARLLLLVRSVLITLAATVLGAVVVGAGLVWWSALIGGASLGAAHALLRSRSYAGLVAFFSLKREYRRNHEAARRRVLDN